ncbi:MAG: heavy metal-associated domain-containing protein [Planctomycetota bacterium]|nr:heavy metal-associated domain-containing protein [Planctomycetota bacterium]
MMILGLIILCSPASSAAEPNRIKHQITGLFSRERVKDLEEVFKQLPEFRLVTVDYDNAEASFEYDPVTVFPGATSEQVVERFDARLKNASRHTFGIKPLRTIEREKLKLIEIPVAGLDCKGCCLGAYEAIYRLNGVEMATASFKERLVTALVEPELIDREALETALRQRGVEVTKPQPENSSPE